MLIVEVTCSRHSTDQYPEERKPKSRDMSKNVRPRLQSSVAQQLTLCGTKVRDRRHSVPLKVPYDKSELLQAATLQESLADAVLHKVF